MVKVKIDMTGWNMWEHGFPNSRLTVVQQAEDWVSSDGTHYAQWLCKCNCIEHNEKIIQAVHLKSGKILSCGCLQKEIACKTNSKSNTYDLSGEYGVLWSTNTSEEVYFDLCNAEKILQHTWHCDDAGYPTTSIDGKLIRMHVFLGCKWHDHEDRNKRNNQLKNLRPCNAQQNAKNTSKINNTTSSFIGVFQRTNGKWVAGITIDGHSKYLGSYTTEEMALVARLKAEKKYYGEWAPQKDLFDKYNI
jgi:hypothetical protein